MDETERDISPFDYDLSKIITRTNRRTPHGRAKTANDVVTKGYIAAGMRLIQQALGRGATAPPPRGQESDCPSRPVLLDWLSQRRVADEVANNPAPLPRQGTHSALRKIWEPHSNFIADLLSFGLWSTHYSRRYQDKIGELVEDLITTPNFTSTAHQLCYWNLKTLSSMPRWRLQLVASVISEQDSVIAKALSDYYSDTVQEWQEVHQLALNVINRRLRPDITLDDISNLIGALAEGFALRLTGDPNAEVIDHSKQRSLYGTGCLAILYACTEQAEEPDPASFEHLLRQTLDGQADSTPNSHDPD
ncbi:hypothetical protein Q5425_03005 [Amycolatopsis sp. A133]|uniref:hypothetical protein n=1 Tax=Amycolatopsis sp. A133 TaxID=3064472 RepID=UPI0027F7B861|nr:hypothetical protein [Amycolatopsis sp. A133]MDQ7802684.1 hypothetical protein [Amycolatopsis sp. A133]